MNGHLSPEAFGIEMCVRPDTVREWIRDGRLFASKHRGRWWIPREDASLFKRTHNATAGSPLSPRPPTGFIPRRGVCAVTRATTEVTFYVSVPPELAHLIDDIRRASGTKMSRSDVVVQALQNYGGEE